MHHSLANAARRALAVAAIATAFAAQPSFAATQGVLGATSQGSISISASVPARARITGLGDLSFADQDPDVAISRSQSICVWSNTATKRYTVTATGDGSSNAFTLANSTLTVPYTVQWSGSTGASSGTSLVTNTASAAFTSNATHQSCSSGPSASASLVIGVGASDLATMQAATTYSGVLTLVVTPQ